MKLALPSFQFRFMPSAGNVIFPGNFHPVGTQAAADQMVDRCGAMDVEPGAGGRWLILGGSGGFGSAARVALACDRGAHTVNFSFDAEPQPQSNNKIRKIGSPAWHRTAALERRLRARGLQAWSRKVDAFDPEGRAAAFDEIAERFGGEKLDGIVWALAAPRANDPRTGKAVKSALKPLGGAAKVLTFTGPQKDRPEPSVVEIEIPPGSPEEAIATQFVMGGDIVETWVEELLARDLLAEGAQLLTISYRGNPLNAPVYRKGLIGLAKAHLEFTTKALDARLQNAVKGRALAVEGPAVVTEASGGIPGVPLYMALIQEVMGESFEDPLDNMRRMFSEKLAPGSEPVVDGEGLVRMDDRELEAGIQDEMQRRFARLEPGASFDQELFDSFMKEYSRTRGFEIEGVDYSAEFDTDEICAVD